METTWAVVMTLGAAAGVSVCGSAAAQDWPTVPFVDHSAYQAVNPDGSPAYAGGFPLRLQGVLLNSPGTVFDNTPDFVSVNWPATAFQFGARQQVYFQATQPGDSGGTAMFLAQSLGNHPTNQDDFFSYTDAEWLDELDRVNFDAATGHEFAAGDLVEVRARIGLHFSGKYNVNEAHNNDPSADFELVLIQAGFGLPSPTGITIADIKDSSDADIFDPTRTSGGELYQSTRVLLRGVTLVDPAEWTAESTSAVVTDGTRTLPLLLGTDPAITPAAAPGGMFDVVGIMDQEASVRPVGGNDGYRLVITAADDVWTRLCANQNGDGQVTPGDFNAWIVNFNGGDARADVNLDGALTPGDFNAWVLAFNQGVNGPRCPG
ncbi:MAG: GC-type dockerin domain-anchored protein [Planctomycetota bacterium]